MITRIEIDGFKSFADFSMDVAPFQVLIGPNGAGKSNLFDALRFFSTLATTNLQTALDATRGAPEELFRMTPDGRVDAMRFAVEMLVPTGRTDPDSAARKRCRYSLKIAHSVKANALAKDALGISDETLRFAGDTPAFFDRDQVEDGAFDLLNEYAAGPARPSNAHRTALSTVSTENVLPSLFSVRKALQRWRVLRLTVDALRTPSRSLSRLTLDDDGGNLSGVLYRLKTQSPGAFAAVRRGLANVVPDAVDLHVRKDEYEGRYEFRVEWEYGTRFPPHLLSDGTLRVLALLALAHDPQHGGTVMIEEPENGVHPGRLKRMARVYRALASDDVDGSDDDASTPRQCLLSTHSPVLVKHLAESALADDAPLPRITLVTMASRVGTGRKPQRVTQALPVDLGLAKDERPSERAADAYALDQVVDYLNDADTSDLVDRLRSTTPA